MALETSMEFNFRRELMRLKKRRDRAIRQLAARGASQREIARALHVALGQVNKVIANGA